MHQATLPNSYNFTKVMGMMITHAQYMYSNADEPFPHGSQRY
jgi:hypothetical protein